MTGFDIENHPEAHLPAPDLLTTVAQQKRDAERQAARAVPDRPAGAGRLAAGPRPDPATEFAVQRLEVLLSRPGARLSDGQRRRLAALVGDKPAPSPAEVAARVAHSAGKLRGGAR